MHFTSFVTDPSSLAQSICRLCGWKDWYQNYLFISEPNSKEFCSIADHLISLLWQWRLQQVTRGHTIVEDGRAGASKTYPHPNRQTSTKSIYNAHFSTFRIVFTDQRTDKDSYRVACPQLKMIMIWTQTNPFLQTFWFFRLKRRYHCLHQPMATENYNWFFSWLISVFGINLSAICQRN